MSCYNKDNRIIVYNTDCVLMMDKMIQNNIQVDCICSDPAYPTTSRGCAGNSGGMCQKDIFCKGKVFNNNSCNVKVWMPKCYELLKKSGHAYFMTNDKNLIEYLKTIEDCGFHFIKDIIWHKDNKIMGSIIWDVRSIYYFAEKEKALR